jgi:hypothetical protein
MRWKFQYSLSSLLWFVFCFALLLTSFLMYRRMSKAEQESAILRKDAGYLAVGDENLFYAVSVKTYEPYAWRWRIYVPSGHRLSLKVASGEIAKEGIPAIPVNSSVLYNNQNEMMLNAALRQDKDNRWLLFLTLGHGKSGVSGQSFDSIPIPDAVAKKNTDGNGAYNIHFFGADGADTQAMDKPIVLLRYRLAKISATGGYGEETPDPMLGFIIWLEVKKK